MSSYADLQEFLAEGPEKQQVEYKNPRTQSNRANGSKNFETPSLGSRKKLQFQADVNFSLEDDNSLIQESVQRQVSILDKQSDLNPNTSNSNFETTTATSSANGSLFITPSSLKSKSGGFHRRSYSDAHQSTKESIQKNMSSKSNKKSPSPPDRGLSTIFENEPEDLEYSVREKILSELYEKLLI